MWENIMWQLSATFAIFLSVANFISLEKERSIPFESPERSFGIICYYVFTTMIFLFVSVYCLQKVFCEC